MFAIAANDTYFTDVEVNIPTGNGAGKVTKHKFKVQFRRLSKTELREVFRRLDDKRLAEGEEKLSDEQLLDDVMVGWEGVLDKQGNVVAFAPETKEKLMDIYPVEATVIGAFFDSIKTAPRKN
ncbi:MAG: hypothetical protein M3Y65_21735 [Pseudomonadota bacterium]|nr:hypothetical protein [Pseudomonadota bacterium]